MTLPANDNLPPLRFGKMIYPGADDAPGADRPALQAEAPISEIGRKHAVEILRANRTVLIVAETEEQAHEAYLRIIAEFAVSMDLDEAWGIEG